MEALAHPLASRHRIWVVGRDDVRPWKRRASALGISDRVRFLGERRDLEVIYAAVDAMVLPTRYDPFANVTIEAAAAGLPIVTSSANGAAEWLGDAMRSLKDPEDSEALASALNEFSHREQRRSAGASLARHARQFGWDRHVETLRSEYARIVASKRKRGSE